MPIVKLPTGELRDEIRTALYDTQTYAASTSPVGIVNFFSAVQGKPKNASNLRQNNMLETAVSYKVYALGLDGQNVYAANWAFLPLVMECSSIALQIGEKKYWEGNALFACGRLKAFTATAVSFNYLTTPATVLSYSRCYQRFGDVQVVGVTFQGRHAIEIPPLQSFKAAFEISSDLTFTMNAAEVVLATPAAVTRERIMFSLKGYLRRPVQ